MPEPRDTAWIHKPPLNIHSLSHSQDMSEFLSRHAFTIGSTIVNHVRHVLQMKWGIVSKPFYVCSCKIEFDHTTVLHVCESPHLCRDQDVCPSAHWFTGQSLYSPHFVRVYRSNRILNFGMIRYGEFISIHTDKAQWLWNPFLKNAFCKISILHCLSKKKNKNENENTRRY